MSDEQENQCQSSNPAIHKPHISWSDSYTKAQDAIQSLSSILHSIPTSLSAADSPATALLHDPDVAAQITHLLLHPNSGAGDDNLCRWLYDTFQSAQPDLHLVVLRFLPVLAGVYLSRASLHKPLAGFEAVLLSIYAYETATRNGQAITVSIPDISHSSIYHETKQTAKNGATELHLAVISPSLDPHGTVRSTRRARIVGVALELYYNKISYMPDRSKIEFCEFCETWSGHKDDRGVDPEGLTPSSPSSSSPSSQVKEITVERNSDRKKRDRKVGRITLSWELLQPVLRILGHCLMGPNRDKQLFESAHSACRCLYARSLHDIDPKAIMSTGSLLKLAKMADDQKEDDIDHTEISMSNPGAEDHKQQITSKQLQLQEEVEKLEEKLGGERQLNRVLQCAVQGSFASCDSCFCLSSLLPFKVQVLLTELALVEEEVDWLETKINELNLDFLQERQWRLQPLWDPNQMTSRRRQSLIEHRGCQVLMGVSHPEGRRKSRHPKERRASLGSSLELQSATFLGTNEENGNSRSRAAAETEAGSPNKLAVELIKCLIGIFLNLKKTALKRKGSANIPKHSLPCSNSKGLVSRATFGCRTPLNHNVSQPDPYGVLHEPEFSVRDVGPYKNFIQITKSSVDLSRFSDQCLPDRLRLRALLQKLSMISTSWLNHKQKLAFWINVYNACIMHAFLQHGLPSTPERHLALINQAAINVGGITLHAFTIEHFILRHPIEVQQDLTNEKERLLISHACGLGYPEPNVIFALCRGSWSSPALKYYTPDEVMNELEKAKVEYLEASLGITSEKKILVPKLMQWHMKDFADDVESLVEWIYSQLPQTSSLKRLIKECLHGETQCPSQKPIEIQPYVSEFRYLLPL